MKTSNEIIRELCAGKLDKLQIHAKKELDWDDIRCLKEITGILISLDKADRAALQDENYSPDEIAEADELVRLQEAAAALQAQGMAAFTSSPEDNQ